MRAPVHVDPTDEPFLYGAALGARIVRDLRRLAQQAVHREPLKKVHGFGLDDTSRRILRPTSEERHGHRHN